MNGKKSLVVCMQNSLLLQNLILVVLVGVCGSTYYNGRQIDNCPQEETSTNKNYTRGMDVSRVFRKPS